MPEHRPLPLPASYCRPSELIILYKQIEIKTLWNQGGGENESRKIHKETDGAIIFLFIFAAEILGEVNHYYTRIPGWDTILHTMNGFLCAAIGFSLVYLLNRGSKNVNLSPFYLTLVAFCFSMTIGVVWEFFEFTMDQFFLVDMQKDFTVTAIGSVSLDPEQAQNVIRIKDIVQTAITTGSGEVTTIEGGYLDIGIIDTMKDLLVNLVGAIVFSVIGYFTLKNSKTSKVAESFMIKPNVHEENEAANDEVKEEKE